jgi:predicted TIM-barrel fold metal-dependent hydrolase
MFVGRIPAKLVDRAPRVVTLDSGGDAWLYDNNTLPNVGLNAVVGRPVEEWSSEPARFQDMRRGAWDIEARVADMDIDGVYASLNFPSFLAGFGGARLQTATPDLELALACVRAWNDWHIEEWAGRFPDRIIPAQIAWLHDPALGADEIYRNAERGFKAVTFPEAMENFGLPSIHTSHWDPIMAACAETETVVCIHIGSAGALPAASPGAPQDVPSVLFGTYAMSYTVEWLFSLIPVRFPGIKICVSEGGIGWVAALFDRLDHSTRYQEMFETWKGVDLSPAEVLRRNFWFCALDDPSAFVQAERIGVERILVEVDYPHADSVWPDTQEKLRHDLDALSDEVKRRITWQNASELFRHPVPDAVQRDPHAF